MLCCICGISYSCAFIIWIRSGGLFIYFVASLRHNCGWSTFYLSMLLLNVNITFTLLRIFHIILIGPTHNSIMRIVFYLWCLMNHAIVHILINVIRRMMHRSLKQSIIPASRLQAVSQMRIILLSLIHHVAKLCWVRLRCNVVSTVRLLLLSLINVCSVWSFLEASLMARSLDELWLIS